MMLAATFTIPVPVISGFICMVISGTLVALVSRGSIRKYKNKAFYARTEAKIWEKGYHDIRDGQNQKIMELEQERGNAIAEAKEADRAMRAMRGTRAFTDTSLILRSDLLSEIKVLKAELKNSKANTSPSDEDLRGQLEDLQNELSDTKSDMQGEIDALEKSNDELLEEKQEMENERDELQEKLDKIEGCI